MDNNDESIPKDVAGNPPARMAPLSSSSTQIDGMNLEISALEQTLGEVTNEKTTVEESLKHLVNAQQQRAEELEQKRKDLRVGSAATTDPLLLKVDYLLANASSNLDGQWKSLVVELKERIVLQEAKNKKLAFELEMECGHVNILRAENLSLKQQTVKMQANMEQEEEFITNKLIHHINGLKREKEELLLKVEQEEEQITNTLQRKLAQLQKEKIDMELVLEQEQEFIVNRLQRQLESLLRQQQAHSGSNHSLTKKPSGWLATPPVTDIPPSPSLSPGYLEVLKAENTYFKARLQEMERDQEEAREAYKKCKAEIVELRAALGMNPDDVDAAHPPILEKRRSLTLPPSNQLQQLPTSLIASSPALSVSHQPGQTSNMSFVPSSPSMTVSTQLTRDRSGRSSYGSPLDSVPGWGRGDRTSRSVSSTRGSMM